MATMLLFVVLTRVSPSFAPDAKGTPGTGVVLVVLAAGLLAAMGGGWTSGRLAPASAWPAVLGLAGLILVLGVVTFFLEKGHPGPMWYRLSLPVVGIAGCLLGGRLVA